MGKEYWVYGVQNNKITPCVARFDDEEAAVEWAEERYQWVYTYLPGHVPDLPVAYVSEVEDHRQ